MSKSNKASAVNKTKGKHPLTSKASKKTDSNQSTKKSFKSNALFETFKKEKFVKSLVKNIVVNFNKFQHGDICSETYGRVGEHLIAQKLKKFDIYRFEPSTFNRRITALKFHPSKPIFAVGDKSGELVLRDLHDDKKVGWAGTGPGGSITSIVFDSFTSDCLLTSSLDGTVQKRNYGNHKCQVLLETGCFEKWFCSVNSSSDTGLIVAGDTHGVLTILSKQYKTVCNYKLHKGKINSAEFSKSRGWLLATASLDKTVKLWDLRKIEEKSPVHVLPHDHPINAAVFSAVDGNRLLTTDQQRELRVYKAPVFELETLIHHPHRQFQHVTPIRACWHPLTDLVVVGRYPDPSWPTYTHGELRTVDVFSAASGEMLTQMYSVNCKCIISLTGFDSTGEVMASGMGSYVPYWRARHLYDKLAERKEEAISDEEPDSMPKIQPPMRVTCRKNKESTKTKKK